MMVYEDEDGQLCTEALPEEIEEVLQDLGGEEDLEQINTLNPDYEEGSDDELVPEAFLGL